MPYQISLPDVAELKAYWPDLKIVCSGGSLAYLAGSRVLSPENSPSQEPSAGTLNARLKLTSSGSLVCAWPDRSIA